MIRYWPGVNGAWTATCTRCGEGSQPYPAKSMARQWGDNHECQQPEGDAA